MNLRQLLGRVVDIHTETDGATPVMVLVEGMSPLRILHVQVEYPTDFEGSPDSMGPMIWLHAEEA